MSGLLEEMTLEQVRALAPEVVVLGIASTEPHGSHLPYGTDFFQCDGQCRRAVTRANERGGRVLMYPTLAIANNVNFKAFPFACRIRVRTLMNVLLDIFEALEEDGIRKIVLVNGHGGNTDTLHAVLREHMGRHRPEADRVGAFVCLAGSFVSPEAARAIEHHSDHAGENETSRMLYLRPDLVKTEKFVDQPVGRPFIESLAAGKAHFVRPWHLHVPLSGGGKLDRSTADKGRGLIESSADNLADFLVELSKAPWGPNFPYPE